ncbi:DUF6318 family protein [Serinicoccus marinus]|uniref:DUF6318 family protein n=1 Tax=Serinicoccus marinus TaxID=247333 RepID=UPI002491FD0E|nr:DUF6318 family protein [Serinicoccus marinus]
MTRTTVVAAVVGLVLLAGCDSSTEPSAPPTSQDALTTPTEEPSEDTEATSEPAETSEEATTEEPDAGGPPEMPDEATEQTEAGAEAFVSHYLDTYNRSFSSGDATLLEPFGTAECASCEGLIATIPTQGASSDEALSYQTPNGLLTPEGARVQVDVTQRATDEQDAADGTIVVTLVWSDSTWLINEIQIQQT